MQLSGDGYRNPGQTNRALYGKYSSSQTYYYSNIMSEIVKQKRSAVNITYEDLEYYCETEEYLKRFYQNQEYPGKMFTFKEYYFYHEDCPRIFMKYIQQLYSKWQDRKRDLVYKKLKIMYNESMSTSRSSSKEDDHKSTSGLEHFLLEISDYNPFSKKYYLRVEAKQKLHQNQNQLTKTVKDLSSLNHDLSVMLNDISQLSVISTLQQNESPRFSTLYHSKKLKVNSSYETSTNHNSQSNSNIQSSIKFNFRKNKNTSKDNQRLSQQFQNKIELRQKSHQKSNRHLQTPSQNQHRLSPKFSNNKLDAKEFNTTSVKSKSIIQVSSFNPNPSRKSQNILNLNINFSKKQSLKLKSDKNPVSREKRITLESKPFRIYESQKKPLIKSQSHRKTPHTIITEQQKIPFESLSKKASTIMTSSKNLLKAIERKNTVREEIGNLISQNKNQFSDNKFQQTAELRLRSHKSEYFSLPKHSLLSRASSPSKISLKINQQNKKYVIKDKINVQIGKRSHQLKIQ